MLKTPPTCECSHKTLASDCSRCIWSLDWWFESDITNAEKHLKSKL